MANEEFVVVADLDGSTQDSRIFLAAPITVAEIEELYVDRIASDETVRWGEREGAVLARKQRRLGALVLEDKPLAKPDAEKLKAAMLDGVRQLGLGALPWNDDLAKWRERVAFLRRLDESWPDLSDTALLASLESWLAPFLDKVSRRDHLARIDLGAALKALVPWDKQRTLDRLAPTHIDVPSGSRVPVDYANPAEPTLSVRLQEMFGSGHAAGRRRQGAAHAPSALAGAAAGAGDARPRELLGHRLPGGEGRAEGPLSAPLLAGRSAGRRADGVCGPGRAEGLRGWREFLHGGGDNMVRAKASPIASRNPSPMSLALPFQTAKQLAAAVRKKKIGCLELLDLYLKRVEAYNPELNAIIATDIEGARKRAKAADKAVKAGRSWGRCTACR